VDVTYFGRGNPNNNAKPAGTDNFKLTLVLTLKDNVTAPTQIGIDFGRLVRDQGGEIITQAIDDAANTYFAPGGLPMTATIAAGGNTATFGPIIVRGNATAGGAPSTSRTTFCSPRPYPLVVPSTSRTS
jgi:hypothetical protein